MRRTDGVPYAIEWRLALARLWLWFAIICVVSGLAILVIEFFRDVPPLILGAFIAFAFAWEAIRRRRELLAAAKLEGARIHRAKGGVQ